MVEMINKLYIFWWPWGRVSYLKYPQIWALTPKCSYQTTIIHIGPSEPFGGRRGWVRFLEEWISLALGTYPLCLQGTTITHIGGSEPVRTLSFLSNYSQNSVRTYFTPSPLSVFFSTLSWTKILPLLVLLASFRRNKNLEV